MESPPLIDGIPSARWVRPETVDGLAEAIREAKGSIVPRGAGTQLEFGNPLRSADCVVDMRGLDRITAYHPADLTIHVEAGLTLGSLQRALEENNQALPLDPWAGPSATIGGIAAVNAQGPLRAIGTIRDWIIGMRVVHADGTSSKTGGRVVKNVTGYDLAKLYTGSLGTLAVIAEVSLKLRSGFGKTATAVAEFDRFADAAEAVNAIRRGALQPIACEFSGPRPTVWVRFGEHPKAVDWQIANLPPAEWEVFEGVPEQLKWESLRMAFQSMGPLVIRTIALPAAIPELIQTFQPASWIAHALNGIVLMVVQSPEDIRRIRSRFPAIIEKAPREVRREIATFGVMGVEARLMKEMKRELDPEGRLNLEGTWMENNKLYLDCIHCGLCLTSCPTYRVLGNEMDSPRGRIYLMRAFDEGRAAITDSFTEHMFRCLDCRACETACPSGVQFGRMMEDMREKIVEQRPAGWLERFILERIFPHPGRFHAASRLLQLYQHSGMQAFLRSTGLMKRIAPKMAAAEALMPQLEIDPGVALDSFYHAEGKRVGAVAFFTGCVMNSMLGSINRASVRLLAAAGYDVIVPGDQVCCGALANHAGLRPAARQMAQANLRAFSPADVDAIIINAAGCGAMLKEYGHLLNDAAPFSSKVMDISEFLAATRIREQFVVPLKGRIGYDDPCHLIHGQGVRTQPRVLLKAIPQIEFVEIEGADQCCGSAGIYNLTQTEISMQILDAKMERIRNSGIDILATGNPGCMFQFRYGAQRAGMALEVVHPVELLARSLG